MCFCTCSLQIFLLLSIILSFFLITTSISHHVRLGLYNQYLKQHRAVFGLSALALMLVGCVGAYRLVRLLSFSSCWPGCRTRTRHCCVLHAHR